MCSFGFFWKYFCVIYFSFPFFTTLTRCPVLLAAGTTIPHNLLAHHVGIEMLIWWQSWQLPCSAATLIPATAEPFTVQHWLRVFFLNKLHVKGEGHQHWTLAFGKWYKLLPPPFWLHNPFSERAWLSLYGNLHTKWGHATWLWGKVPMRKTSHLPLKIFWIVVITSVKAETFTTATGIHMEVPPNLSLPWPSMDMIPNTRGSFYRSFEIHNNCISIVLWHIAAVYLQQCTCNSVFFSSFLY